MNAKKLHNYLEGAVPVSIGERIDLFLLTKNITRAKFGSDLGITGTTITSYCSGKSKPNSDFLESAASVFDLNPMWLLFGQGPMILSEAGLECPRQLAEEPADYQSQVIELKHELADKDRELAAVERAMGKQQSLIFEAVRQACREQSLTPEQATALQWAVMDYEGAQDSPAWQSRTTLCLIEKRLGIDKRCSGSFTACPGGAPLRLISSNDEAPLGRSRAQLSIRTAAPN